MASNIANMTVNIKGLDRLEEFLEKHSESLSLMSVLDLKPGDTIVLSHPIAFSEHEKNVISQQFKEAFPGNRLLLLECGITLQGIFR